MKPNTLPASGAAAGSSVSPVTSNGNFEYHPVGPGIERAPQPRPRSGNGPSGNPSVAGHTAIASRRRPPAFRSANRRASPRRRPRASRELTVPRCEFGGEDVCKLLLHRTCRGRRRSKPGAAKAAAPAAPRPGTGTTAAARRPASRGSNPANRKKSGSRARSEARRTHCDMGHPMCTKCGCP